MPALGKAQGIPFRPGSGAGAGIGPGGPGNGYYPTPPGFGTGYKDMQQWLVEDYDIVPQSQCKLDKIAQPTYVDVNVMNFDGTANSQLVFTSFSTYTDYEGHVWFRDTAATGSAKYIIDGRDAGNDGFRLIISSLGYVLATHNATSATVTVNFSDSKWHFARWRHEGGTLYLSVDGIEADPVSTTGDIDVSLSNYIGRTAGATNRFTGQLFAVRHVTDQGEGWELPAQEGQGIPSNWYDSARQPTGSSAMLWTTSDGIESANLRAGHTPAGVGDTVGIIDTGIAANTISKVTIVTGNATLSGVYNGAGATGTASMLAIGYTNGGVRGEVRFLDKFYNIGDMIAPTEIAIEIVSPTQAYVYVDGVLETVQTGAGTIASDTFALFGRHNGGYDLKHDAPLYSCKIEVGGELVRDMIPVNNGQWLDRVNNQLYGDVAAGTLETRYNPAIQERVYDQSALVTDGAGDYWSYGVLEQIKTTTTFYAKLRLKSASIDPTTGARVFSIRFSGNDDIRVWYVAGGFRVTMDDTNDSGSITVPRTTDEFMVIEFYHDGSELFVYKNGVLEGSFVRGFNYAGMDGLYELGRIAGGASYSPATLYSVEVGASKTDIWHTVDFTQTGEFDYPASWQGGDITTTSGLQTMWQKYYKAQALPTKSELTFDGVGDYLLLASDVNLVGDFSVKATLSIGNSAASNHWVVSSNDGLDAVLVTREGAGYTFRTRIGGTIYNSGLSTDVLYDGNMHDVEVRRTGSTIEYFVDGVSQGTQVASAADIPVRRIMRQGNSGNYVLGTCRSLDINGQVTYDFTTHTGKKTAIIPDLSGNGNNGLINTTTSGLETMWGSRWSNRGVGPDSAVRGDASGQYIDVGLPYTENTKIEWIGTPLDTNISGMAFGVFNLPPKRGGLTIAVGGRFDANRLIASVEQSSFIGVRGVRYTVEFSNDEVRVDGAQILGPVAADTPTTDANIYLFARNRGDITSTDLPFSGTTQSFKVWESGVLVRDMVPQIDGTFLDRVNNVVYSNDGTGTLTTVNLVSDGEGDLVDAQNFEILEWLGGFPHNNSEVALLQSSPVLSTQNNFWWNIAFLRKRYSDLITHGNGGNVNLWLKQHCYRTNGHFSEICQYDFAWAPTVEDINRATKYFTWCHPTDGLVEIEYDADLSVEINADGSYEYVQSV